LFDNELNVKEIIRIIYRHKQVVFLSLFLVVAVVFLLLKFEKPAYRSVVKLTVLERSVTDVITDNVDTGTHLTIANQLDVLQSQNFLEQVVTALPPDIYDDYAIYNPSKIRRLTDQVKNVFRNLVGLRQTQLNEKAIAIENIAKMMTVKHQGGGVIQITFKSGNAAKAQKVAEIIGNEFIRFNIENLRKRLTIIREYFARQTDQAYQDMKRAESELQEFKKNKGLTSGQGESEEMAMRLNSLESSYVEVKTQRELAEKRLSMLNQRMDEVVQKFPRLKNLETNIPEINNMKQRLLSLEKERLLTSAIYTDKHPKMVGITTQIEETIRDLRHLTQTVVGDSSIKDVFNWQDLYFEKLMTEVEIGSLISKEESYGKLVDNYRHKILYEIPEKEQGLSELIQKLEMARQAYQSIVNNSERISMVEVEKVGNVQVLTPATLPVMPDKSQLALKLLFSIFAGTLLGIATAFFMEWYNTAIRTIEEVESKLNLPVISAVPDIQSLRRLDKNLKESVAVEKTKSALSMLFVHVNPNSLITESFRRLHSEIELLLKKEGQLGKAFIFTSAGPNEGKSTLAANLAYTIAQAGRKVVLIDGDLRRPSLHHLFGMNRDFGVVDLLKNGTLLERIIPNHRGAKKWLELITSGKEIDNPIEYLATPKLAQFVELLRIHYDYVIIDTPPLVTFSDAIFLGNVTDGALMVVRSGKTQFAAAERCKSMLAKSNIPILGVVVNGIDYRKQYGPVSYYDQYYKSYYYRYKNHKKDAVKDNLKEAI